MSRMEKQFAAMLAEEVKPVESDEVVKPTRVVWRAQAGQIRTRVFPTEQRAIDFAATIPGSEISDVTEPVPRQPAAAVNAFHRHVRFTETRRWMKSKRSA